MTDTHQKYNDTENWTDALSPEQRAQELKTAMAENGKLLEILMSLEGSKSLEDVDITVSSIRSTFSDRVKSRKIDPWGSTNGKDGKMNRKDFTSVNGKMDRGDTVINDQI